MSTQMAVSLHTLPIELIYRILDNFNNETIFLSCTNVCTRLNAIVDTYQRYQVIFGFIMKSHNLIILGACCHFPKKKPYYFLLLFMFMALKRQISYDSILYL